MRKPLHDTEWDDRSAAYDRHVPHIAADEPAADAPRRRNLRLKHALMLALAFFALPLPGQLRSADGATAGLTRDAVFSFSPVEVTLPPIEVSLARLADESASATCWVLELRPRGTGCVPAR